MKKAVLNNFAIFTVPKAVCKTIHGCTEHNKIKKLC